LNPQAGAGRGKKKKTENANNSVKTSYENQVEVGQGIARAFKEFGIKREDVFIVSCENTGR
jgi:hypothetical protein